MKLYVSTSTPLATAMVLAVGLGSCRPEEKAPVPADETAEFLDPVAQDPEHYALELENPYVRVVRENVPAGTNAPMHSHRERVSVFLKDSKVTLVPREGDPVLTQPVAGTTRWDEPATHRAVVEEDVENLSIELKDLSGSPVDLPDLDALAVDPEHHVVDFENDRVRVVRMTYPPGTKTPLHRHLSGFGVFLTDAHGRNVTEEGDVVPIDAKAGSTFWTEGGSPPHVTENLSEDELVVLIVEMKRRPGE